MYLSVPRIRLQARMQAIVTRATMAGKVMLMLKERETMKSAKGSQWAAIH